MSWKRAFSHALGWFGMILLACMPASAQAQAPVIVPLNTPMVADISQNTVEIHASFNGTQLLIFGARNQPGDIVIAVRGPQADLLMRRKERIAGMWMHVEQQKYGAIPTFYALASTRKLEELAPAEVLQTLGLGGEEVIKQENPGSKPLFDAALMQRFGKRGLWQLPFSTITYFGESLFKAKLNLPDTLPEGDFTVEIYLFDHGAPISVQVIPLHTFKTGFDARVFTAAQRQSLGYGIAAILMALCGGWLAHRLFNRRK